MKIFLLVLAIVSSLVLMLLVLLHRGKGGGVQSSLSGSSVVEKNLDRLTVIFSIIWLISIIAMGVVLRLGV